MLALEPEPLEFRGDPAWLRRAAQELAEPAPSVDALSEHDEIVAELQDDLRWEGERPAYELPDLSYVDKLETTGRRADCEHPLELRWVAGLPTAELVERVGWVHKHRGRGLSRLDIAVQLEWSARSLGHAFFFCRKTPWLPPQLVHLAGRRALVRRTILAALCLSIVKRANGITISAPEAQRLWSITPSTWWEAIAWLEARGLLVRMRRYKGNDGHTRAARARGDDHVPAPVQFIANWYGPGPELVAIGADRIRAAFRCDASPAEIEAEAARAQEDELEARRARAREQRQRRREDERRRRGEDERGRPAPRWAMAVVAAAFAAAATTTAHADAGRRLEAMRSGELAVSEAIGQEPPPPPRDVELELELEQLANAMPPDTGPRELEALAEQRERDGRIATAPPAFAVRFPDGTPSGLRSRAREAGSEKGSAHRSSAARSAAPSRARDDGDNVPSSRPTSSPTTAGREVIPSHERSAGDSQPSSPRSSPPSTAGPPGRSRLAELVARAAAAFGFGVRFGDDESVGGGR